MKLKEFFDMLIGLLLYPIVYGALLCLGALILWLLKTLGHSHL